MLTEKQKKALKRYERETPIRDTAFGVVTEVTKPLSAGLYRLLPLAGGIRVNKDGDIKLVISGTVLRAFEAKNVGILNWGIPMTPANIPKAVQVMAALGWDGKVWPLDGGWPHPTDNEDEAKGLEFIMRDLKLAQVFTFPPDAVRGSRVLKFVLGHTVDFFPMPLTLSPEDIVEVPATYEARLRALLDERDIFKPRDVNA